MKARQACAAPAIDAHKIACSSCGLTMAQSRQLAGLDAQKVTPDEFVIPLLEALQMYADPGFYHACSFAFDLPTGGFDEDFDHDEDYGRLMPGKLARQTLDDFEKTLPPEVKSSPAQPVAGPQGFDAEFLSKRLGRVAALAGVSMPKGMSHEQIAEVAGTILGQIAGKLERTPSN